MSSRSSGFFMRKGICVRRQVNLPYLFIFAGGYGLYKMDKNMQRSKIFLLAAFAAGAFLLNACSPKVTRPVAEAGTPAKPEVHYTEAQLAEGKTLFTGSCGRCHKLFEPASKSVSKWESVLPRMIKRAKLSEEQGALVRAYIMANVKS
jgi:mono/diheme cytochrome c family protein